MSYSDYSLSPKKLIRAFPTLPSSIVRFLPHATAALAFLGFLDATYLTIIHYKNAIPPCTIHGCETVLTSQFATIGNVPISLIGALYYVVVLILVGILLTVIPAKAGIQKENRSLVKPGMTRDIARTISSVLLLLTVVGLLVGVGLVYIQAFVLHAFCQYCLASEVIDFLLFDCAWWLWRRNG